MYKKIIQIIHPILKVTYTDRISIQKTEYLAEWGLSIK